MAVIISLKLQKIVLDVQIVCCANLGVLLRRSSRSIGLVSSRLILVHEVAMNVRDDSCKENIVDLCEQKHQKFVAKQIDVVI